MSSQSGHASRRFAASPYEQPEPPFYLLPGEGRLFAAIGKRAKRVCRRIADKFRGRCDAAEFSDLDDYRLFDIGICRDEIHLAAPRAVKSPASNI